VAGHPIFARFYDRMTERAERSQLAEMRRSLLAEASGRVLEIGAGTGHNLPYYRDTVDELVLAEPDPHMAERLRAKLEREPPAVGSVLVVDAPAEQLPFDNASFDAVVSTLVLCTVADPGLAVAEIRRVLDDDGAFLFLEHVRSNNPRLARFQDTFDRPWGFLAGGCHPNRPTSDALADAGFWIERLQHTENSKLPVIVRPLISGVARRPSGTAAPEY
jgi:ubiquinone/menaquinone biosynthesis C-methylase UbiE